MPIDLQTYRGYVGVLKDTFSSEQWKTQPTEPIKSAQRPDDVTANYLYGQILRVAIQQEGANRYGPQENFMFGCLVIASGISRSRNAYRASCLETSRPESSASLVTALKDPRSASLFTNIAGMPNSKADLFMGQFGLGIPPVSDLPPLLYNQAEQFIEPNPDVFKAAAADVAQWAQERPVGAAPHDERSAQCPARRFIPMLWIRAVDIGLAAGLLEPSATPEATSVVR
ncbi:MAG: hypothetical protein ABI221_02305 [Candidatus Saccharimonadales bacterium]